MALDFAFVRAERVKRVVGRGLLDDEHEAAAMAQIAAGIERHALVVIGNLAELCGSEAVLRRSETQ